MYLESVDLEYTHIPDLPYLARFKQFHLACVLIEVIPQGDAVATAPGATQKIGLCPASGAGSDRWARRSPTDRNGRP